MPHERSLEAPFDLRNNRAMVSLGRVSGPKYCTYSCPFCYTRADFLSYASLGIAEIVGWLRKRRSDFDIVYVSGDTDSFAPPRTERGLELLKALVELRVDLLFTTRAVFTRTQLDTLTRIREELALANCFFFGCVSVVQLSFPHLEPPPIPDPLIRLAQLRAFRERGLISVLAMRPFLPIVPETEYLTIIEHVQSKIDVVLGEVWYADKAGVLEKGVFRGPTPPNVQFVEGRMDFDINNATWKVYEASNTGDAVEQRCRDLSVPFFMRSRPAIEWIREQRTPHSGRTV